MPFKVVCRVGQRVFLCDGVKIPEQEGEILGCIWGNHCNEWGICGIGVCKLVIKVLLGWQGW